MHKNNNNEAVKRLAKRSLKANRTRNIFAIIAIVLTTFMICTVFSVGISFVTNYNTMSIRDAGTNAEIFLDKPSAKQMRQIKNTEGIDTVGRSIGVGRIIYKNNIGEKSNMPMIYKDKNEWQSHYEPAIDNIKGSYPEQADEIMLSRAALKELGISNPKVGMDVQVKCATTRDEVGVRTKGFELTGWYTNFARLSKAGYSEAFVSKKFASQEGANLRYNGGVSISCEGEQSDVYESLKDNVDLRPAQNFDTTFDIGDAEETQSATLLVIVMISLFIVLSGYLLIRNIMYISVSRDIRFYGMLKTIGTSPKQIKRIVKKQIYRLSLIGIPIGLLLSAVTAFGIVPRALIAFQGGGVYSAMPGDVSLNPFIFLGAILFSLLTVIISCRKPAKIASKVSPVEALKYTGTKEKKKGKERNSTSGGKLHKMAFHNIFREKKRAVLVFASLFMGVITLLSVNGFFGSLDLQNYADKYLPYDFTYQEMTGEYLFSEQFVQDIKDIDGIKEVKSVDMVSADLEYDRELLNPCMREGYEMGGEETGSYKDYVKSFEALGDYDVNLFSISKGYIADYNKKLERSGDTSKEKIDIDAFEKGNVIIVAGDYDRYKDMLGQKMNLTTKTGEKVSKEIAGIFSSDDAEIALYQYTSGLPAGVYVSDALFREFTDKPDTVMIDITLGDPAKEASVKAQLQELNSQLASKEGAYIFEAKSTKMEDFTSSMRNMTVMGSGISIILILIALINFINVMLTGVYTRKNELAVMESIGMTKRQVKKMLTFEGLYYAIISGIIVMTAGNGILYIFARVMPKIADYAVFHYPFVLMAGLLVGTLIICTTVPRIVYNTLSGETITERLREVV